jgi:3-keto-disaccharide hydrolase/PA14 domain-containing protein
MLLAASRFRFSAGDPMHLIPRCVLVLILVLGGLSAARAQEGVLRRPGLTVRMYELAVQDLRKLPELVPNQTPNRDRLVPRLNLTKKDFEGVPAPMATEVSGWLLVEEAGSYVFRLTSDDGSRLSLDGRGVINHDGRHGATPKESESLELSSGLHELFIEHFDAGGGRSLRLEWRRPGAETFEVVPAESLRAEVDPTRVTSPGKKAVIDRRKPGTGLPLPGAHPSWRVENLRPKDFKPKVGAMCFLPDGRLAFGTFDPLQRDERSLPDIESKAPDSIWALDLKTMEVAKIGGDVYEPSGMCVVGKDLYVSHRRAIDRLRDEDGDGFYEAHETLGEGWEGWNYHQFVFGLQHIDGYLYATLSTTMAPPGWKGMETNSGPNGPMRGGILEVDLSSRDARVIAGGTRTPNGIGRMRDGSLVYLDNQGTWMPVSVLAEVLPGQFYGHYNWTRFVPKLAERFPEGGHPSIFADRKRMPPALWLPQNEVVNSPTQPLVFEGPFDPKTGARRYPGSQMLIGELTAGGLRRVALERVDGVLQGALIRFSQGFEAGINRMAWGPDGALYVGGMGAGGNWNWKGTQFGLQRLVPTGDAVFELATVKARPGGFLLVFTEPLAPGVLEKFEDFRVASWTYRPTAAYGGPKQEEMKHRVTGIEISTDRRRVAIDVAGLRTESCIHIAFDATSSTGRAIWSGETWYTLNRMPRAEGEAAASKPLVGASPLMPRGHPVQFWQGGPQPSDANLTQDQILAHPGFFELAPGATPIESGVEFRSATIDLEWWCPEDLESRKALGVLSIHGLRLALGAPTPSETLLGSDEAGALLGRQAARVNASAGPGSWQTLRVAVKAPIVRADGSEAPAMIDAFWNGQRIHGVGLSLSPGGDSARDLDRDGVEKATRLRIEHSGGAAAGPLRIRNVMIAAAGASERMRPRGTWIDILRDQSRWTPLGGQAVFSFKDGVLTGETRPNTPNTYLTSRDRYGDFEMLYEFKVDPKLNSGVQIRSGLLGSLEKRDSRMSGYQVEIDPSPRSWTSGIFDEHGRGWLHPLIAAPYARRAFRQGEWNRVRVLAEGARIRTWINGVPAADMTDVRHAEGHLGFQVHGVGGRKEPLRVQWRKVRLRKL